MGREFVDLFETWATTYDATVAGYDPQYRAVFDGYESILDRVTSEAKGIVLEFGIGTGNLSNKLIEAGHTVIGIEPSAAMREAAQTKLPTMHILDGDFLNYPSIDSPIDSIVSSYAFHHLTDDEKNLAIKQFANLLSSGGKVIFADTAYESEEAKQSIFNKAKANNFNDLLQDLSTEYYAMLDDLRAMFEDNGFSIKFDKMNEFVWLMVAEKQ
ncbi:class I SAM-dependent methyltransferase [Bacillus sp. HMF5848]|uniref:class I SAM-dependent methyltransferase n=1 Tax=Bacillus sp. HMF5848 TaxID=2495421 RepID=UPI000F795EF4|nr:class I SAM-dependent methyltransferase [Bacillus sp. HMF5848]RSK29113.1 class I SAM-dependent methyltransferase [Bacillus sp. HMF5848]